MVRPTSSIWIHYVKQTVCGKSVAICKYCQLKYLSPNATKMKRHYEKCIKRPLDLLPSFSSLEENSRGERVAVYNLSPAIPIDSIPDSQNSSDLDLHVMDSIPTTSGSSEGASVPIQKRPRTQQSISSYLDIMSTSEIERLDSAFAKAIYSSNSPLSLSENVCWLEFLHQIRPSYRVPTRYDLTNRLLENEYNRTTEMTMERINKAQCLTIVTDGWSNIRQESIISVNIHTPTPVFFKAIDASSFQHTGPYISDEIIKVIKEVSEEKVIAVVTDNAKNMKNAWKSLQSVYPKLHTVGCSAHGLNLLLGDIAKIGTFQLIITKSKDIIKYFKNKRILLSVFTEKQKQKRGTAASTLKLPCETRWSGLLIMFKSLIDGKESLQETVLNENVDREIRQMVLDNDLFWASVESLASVLKPICDGIAKIESDHAVLSDVPHTFYNIKNSLISLKSTPLQTEEEEEFVSALEEREKMCVQPIHLAAYTLDPRYGERSLNQDEYNTALQFFIDFSNNAAAEIITDFSNFQSKENVYSNDAIWESAKYISPLIWWKGLLKHQSLSQVAVKLFSIPPSSASCERIFSAMTNTHTKLRNRLSNERVAKLIAIRSNLILENKSKSEDYLISNNFDSDNF